MFGTLCRELALRCGHLFGKFDYDVGGGASAELRVEGGECEGNVEDVVVESYGGEGSVGVVEGEWWWVRRDARGDALCLGGQNAGFLGAKP